MLKIRTEVVIPIQDPQRAPEDSSRSDLNTFRSFTGVTIAPGVYYTGTRNENAVQHECADASVSVHAYGDTREAALQTLSRGLREILKAIELELPSIRDLSK